MGLFEFIRIFLKFVIRPVLMVLALGVLIGFMPGLIPETMKFTAYDVKETREFKGALELKNQFENVEKLFENEIHGPEGLLYHKGVLYTTLHGGQVVKIVNDKVVPFVKFGKPCAGFHEEHICGRPLGLAVDSQDNLYVTDAYYGLFKVNLLTKAVEQLVSPNTDIEGRKPKLFNSVVVSSDGIIYWTDSDSNFHVNNIIFSSLADGTGRVIRYDPTTKKNTVLIDRLRFANGVALSPDESFLIVAETFGFRLIKYNLKGPKKGSYETFIDGLPGLPDNLKTDKRGYFYVPLVQPRDEKTTPLLIYNIHKYPLVRRSFAKLLGLLELIFKQLKTVLSEEFCDKAVHMIGHYESMDTVFPRPKRFTLLVVNKEGRIVTSYHSLDGSLIGVCDVEPVGNHLYLGSPYNRFLGRAKLPVELKHMGKI